MRRIPVVYALFLSIMLYGCIATKKVVEETGENPKMVANEYVVGEIESNTLGSWWNFFNDSVLNDLISSALSMNRFPARPSVLGQGKPSATYDSILQEYRDPKVTLISDIAIHYTTFRYAQTQRKYLDTYLETRKGIYANNIEDLKADHKQFGAASDEMDAFEKRRKDLVHQEKDTIAKLARLTQLLPEYIDERLSDDGGIPTPDITPILASDASILSSAPEIVIAQIFHAHKGALFPDAMVGNVYGVSDSAFLNNGSSWRVSVGKAGQAVILPNGAAFNDYRTHVLNYVIELERLIVTYAHLQEQHVLLDKKSINTQEKYELLKKYSGNEKKMSASLKAAQDSASKVSLAALKAQYEMNKTLIDIYRYLGVY